MDEGEGQYRADVVLFRLMGGRRKEDLDLDTATYYTKRGKLV